MGGHCWRSQRSHGNTQAWVTELGPNPDQPPPVPKLRALCNHTRAGPLVGWWIRWNDPVKRGAANEC